MWRAEGSLGSDHQLSDEVETMSEVAQEEYREKQKKRWNPVGDQDPRGSHRNE